MRTQTGMALADRFSPVMVIVIVIVIVIVMSVAIVRGIDMVINVIVAAALRHSSC